MKDESIISGLSLEELVNVIIEVENFKRQEHSESIEKCKKNKSMLVHYNSGMDLTEQGHLATIQN